MVLRIEDVTIRKVLIIESECSIKEATEMMDQYSSSSLVVLENNKVEGILTTRDIVSRVIALGLDPNEVKVRDAMSSPVIMMRPEAPLEEAIKIMIQRKIKKLPLVEGEKSQAKLVGLLSLTDIVEYHTEIFSTLWQQALLTVPAEEEKGDFIVV
ncbi:MAG TPA: CBS domain-containing protein [Patescibacteria group bacterium]|nr:CBS domain-containing protein [Patescibacteria group bacterium]